MAKFLKFFGKKAPHPPRPDYTGDRRDQFSRPADDEFGFIQPRRDSLSDQNGRGLRTSPNSLNTLEGGSYLGTNGSVSSRRTTGQRPNDNANSPTAGSRPVVAEDYSDPKDVVRVAQQAGLVIPPESPNEIGRPPEDDYSVPYDAQKVIEQIKQAGGQKKLQNSEDSDLGNTISTQASLKQSTSSSHQYEEPPQPSSMAPSSPGLQVLSTTDDYADDEGSDQYMDSVPHHHVQLVDHTMRDDISVSSSENSESLRVTRSHSAHQRLQTPQNDARPLGEYDNPWEWKIKPPQEHQHGAAGGGGGGAMKPFQPPQQAAPLVESPRSRSRSDAMHLRGRTSPESDIRPHDEYDQPWEWSKNRQQQQQQSQAMIIDVMHFQGRTSQESVFGHMMTDEHDQRWELSKNKQQQAQAMIIEKENIPTSDHHHHHHIDSRMHSSRKSSQGLKLEISQLKHQPIGETVDPTLSLEEQKWYHGNLSRIDAEKKLKTQKECSYLVRQSESSQRDYSLSLKSTRGFMHMKIILHDEGFILGEFSKPFKTIPEMISYYTGHKLNIKGAAHMALLYPVTIEML